MSSEGLLQRLTSGTRVIVERNEPGVVCLNSAIGCFRNKDDEAGWRDQDEGVMIMLDSGAGVFFDAEGFSEYDLPIKILAVNAD